MRTRTYHLVVAPDGRAPAGSAPELAAVRLISLLPPNWRYSPAYPSDGTLSLTLQPPPGTREEAAHAVLLRTFASPILHGWTWSNAPAGSGQGEPGIRGRERSRSR
ncbi:MULTISPECIES: hypothetical protein [unclassified Streptomyces]|uniref:hypothetical protein n=1 Tax=unclassified Streptomyces TaxID=2593676 RepID=UPI002E2F69F0|nr:MULTISPECIES: hypothetical protein [unclassified Streptomyces]WUC65733.1 hypothetical protein OG861_16630 [Streptomyces sp. NBC_00539]